MTGCRRLAAASTAVLLVLGGAGCSSNDQAEAKPNPTSSRSSSRAAPVRGVVTAVTDASVTVRGEDGAAHTFRFGLKTKVRRAGADASVADLHLGDRIAVYGGTGDSAVRRILIRAGSSPAAGAGDDG